MAAVPQQRRGNTSSISTLLYFLSCLTVTLILSYVRSAGLTEADQLYKEKIALLKALLWLVDYCPWTNAILSWSTISRIAVILTIKMR